MRPNASAIPHGGPAEADYAIEVQKIIRRAVARVEELRNELQAELDQAGT